MSDAIETQLLADFGQVRKIFFRELVLEIAIGVYPRELLAPQRIGINLALYLAPLDPDHGDNLARVFDYDQIRRAIKGLAADGHINLQETLLERIVEICLAPDEVVAVRASTEKLDVYDDCAGVGLETVRIKDR